jgi:uncharacterized membrane protein YtjA (UPF0391 family)
MTKNMGVVDRIIRTVVAVILAALYFTGVVGGTVGVILLIVAAVFLLVSIVGCCPVYMPLGLSTRGKPGGASSID